MKQTEKGSGRGFDSLQVHQKHIQDTSEVQKGVFGLTPPC